ncbi:solute carrier family 2, facilitated glucose transporter member 6-like [Eriocheir sinensis]|uniref:solute carrier family 2, facilitated glucose transporter member 6-like n=1 Tax=Eriocheir sinensis TaxID=95602 RepID=UPI0021C662F2|nr:solute carrier family 2, facilitated glucose transporter member 6-like [Eriocheir sinensis]
MQTYSSSSQPGNMLDAPAPRLASAPGQPAAPAPVRPLSWAPHSPTLDQEKAAKEKVDSNAGPRLCDLEKDGVQDAALRPTLLQVATILLSSLAMLQFGISYSWPNSLAGDLRTDNSTLLGHQISVTSVGHDLVGSLMFAGGVLGTIPASWLVGKFGRRICMVAPSLPISLGWALIAFAHNDILIFVGRCPCPAPLYSNASPPRRFVTGLSLGMMVQASEIYVAEISNASIRGTACTFMEIVKLGGFVLVVAVAIKVSWYVIAGGLAVLALVYGGAMLAVPESPNFLAVQGREEEARRVLRRFRGPGADVDAELALLRHRNQRSDGASGFAALLKRDVLRSVAALLLLITFRSMCGCEMITVHCTRMLLATGVALDHTLGTLIVNSAYLLGGLCLTVLVDRLGRRRSMLVSLAVMLAGNTVLGCYCYSFPASAVPGLDIELLSPLDTNTTVSYLAGNTTVPYIAGLSDAGDSERLLPLLCFLTVAFGAGLGIADIPLVLMVEYFPTNIRAEGCGLCLTWMLVCSTTMLQLYSVLLDSLTIAGIYWFFALSTVAATVHTLCCIRETSKCDIG